MTCPQCKDPWTYRCGGCGTVKTTITWIPVSERLPEAEKSVLLATPNGYSTFGYLNKTFRGMWRSDLGDLIPVADQVFTHWAELPAPPAMSDRDIAKQHGIEPREISKVEFDMETGNDHES